MKKYRMILMLVFFVIRALHSQENLNSETSINWQQDFNVAKEIAASDNKPILLFFTGSDWCSPCKMLVTDFFESEKFSEIALEKFVLYEADFPRNKSLVTVSQKKNNRKLMNKYDVNSYPTILIINAKGKILGKRKGYNLMRDTSYHFSFIDSVLNKLL